VIFKSDPGFFFFYSNFSISLLGIVTLLLFFMTISLFFVSLGMRLRHRKMESLAESYKESFYPLILNYLEDSSSKENILSFFTGKNLEYAVFERTVIRLLKNLDGDEVKNLKELLLIEPIYNYHLNQLTSNNEIIQIKACNYFRFTQLINPKIIYKLRDFVNSENRLLAFSAASALMASREVSIRAEALKEIAKKNNISKMGLLELLYKFESRDNSLKEEEAEALKGLILDAEIPDENKSLLIQGITEMSYYQLSEFFADLISDKNIDKENVKILNALINAQKDLFNITTSPVIRSFLKCKNYDIQLAAIETLAAFGGKNNLSAIYGLIENGETGIQKNCIKSLLNNNISEKDILSNINLKYYTSVSDIIKMTKESM